MITSGSLAATVGGGRRKMKSKKPKRVPPGAMGREMAGPVGKAKAKMPPAMKTMKPMKKKRGRG